jgi:hypothetical protein
MQRCLGALSFLPLEAVMPYATTHPTKEVLQQYLLDRRQSKTPPPSNQEVRRQLGWELNKPYTKDRN